MLLGDLIATPDDESIAMEALRDLDDLALVRRASEAARGGALDLGSFASIAVIASSTRRRPTTGRP